MIDVVEVLQHWHAGRNKTEVGASVGVDRGTVRKYVAAAEAAGFVPNDRVMSRDDWLVRVAEWFPELVDAKVRSSTYPDINVHRGLIETMLETNTVQTVWQRLRDEHALTAGITSFRRYVWLEFPDRPTPDQVTVWRPPVTPGDEAQIDFGYLGQWLDPLMERVRRVWAFVMVMAASRHMFVRPIFTMDQTCWVEAHVAGFEFFGGVPARLVPDNPKTAVCKPDLYDPKLNRAYAELAAHYGCLIDPARASKPKDKPRVERPMPYIRDSFWRGRTWESLDQMQAEAIRWCVRVAGRRRHRGLDGAAPHTVFLAAEADQLRPLPVTAFELAAWATPKVAPDCHAKIAGALYSVPWRWIGTTVDARITDRRVEIFVGGVLIKTHTRVERGRQTDWADYPPEKIAFFQRTPVWCRRRARELGPHVTTVIDGLLETNALHRLRSAQGIIGQADKHGAERLDRACERAIAVGDPSYRTIKGILAAGTETNSDETAQHRSHDPNIAHLHGPETLFANSDRLDEGVA